MGSVKGVEAIWGARAPNSHLRLGVVILTLLAVGLSACASRHPKGVPPEEPVPGARVPYVIGVTDRLSIVVWKNSELSLSVPVRNDGKISVPLLDDVQAEGLTPEELKEVITQELSEYVSSPDVTVIVTEMNSKTATIMGGVARSGQVTLRRETRLLEAIASMGGFSTFAKRDEVRILRPTELGIVEYRFDYDNFLAGKAPGTNIVLRPGDHVVVPD
jgi:polysaccharide export outer membrane protein